MHTCCPAVTTCLHNTHTRTGGVWCLEVQPLHKRLPGILLGQKQVWCCLLHVILHGCAGVVEERAGVHAGG